MTTLAARLRAPIRAPLAAARMLPVAWAEWRAAATNGAQLSMTTSSLFLIIAKVGALGIGFLCWLAAARMFPESIVGLASTTVAATNLVALFAILGIGWSVIGLYPATAEKGRLLDSALSLVGAASLAVSLVCLVFAAVALSELRALATDPRFVLCFLAFGVTGTLGLLLDQISAVMRRGDHAMTRNVVRGVATLVVVPAALLVGEGDRSLALVAAWTAGSVLMIAIGLRQFARPPLRYAFRPRVDRVLGRPLFLDGIPNQVLNLALRLPGTVLPIVVTQMISAGDSAIWYGAWMMASVVFFVPIQIGVSLYAELSHDRASIERVALQALRMSLGLGALCALVAAILVGIPLSMLGHGYAAGGVDPFRIVVIAVLPMTVIEVYCAVCRGLGRLNEAIATGLISAVASLAATVAVASSYGLVGIATAWLAVQAVTGAWAGIRLIWLLRIAPARAAGAIAQPTS
jgi:O-antigen/teichoic acid export membrane protein